MEQVAHIPVTRWWISRVWDRFQLYLTARLFTFAIAMTMGWSTRQRMSHNNGIVGRGMFYIDPDPSLPENDFWVKGDEYPCRIRHAAATFYDDAMAAIRSLSLKLSDERWNSPFDLEMNTGSITLFWNAKSFLKLASLRKERYGVEYGEYYKLYPVAKEGARRTLRRDPSSFTNLIYYNKTPLLYISTDGTKYYAKYRTVPYTKVEETGKVAIGSPQWVEPENQRIDPTTNPLSRNYLKEEFEHTVRDRNAMGDPVKYQLQVQLRRHYDDQDPKIFNCCIDWPEDEFPWRNVGHFEITETLNWEESLKTTFSFNNMPKSLGVIPSKSVFDYNSLNYMRKHIDFAKKVRLWTYKVKGLPPEIPDDNFRNSSWFVDQSRAR